MARLIEKGCIQCLGVFNVSHSTHSLASDTSPLDVGNTRAMWRWRVVPSSMAVGSVRDPKLVSSFDCRKLWVLRRIGWALLSARCVVVVLSWAHSLDFPHVVVWIRISASEATRVSITSHVTKVVDRVRICHVYTFKP